MMILATAASVWSVTVVYVPCRYIFNIETVARSGLLLFIIHWLYCLVATMANKFGMRWIPPKRDPFLPAPYLEEINEALIDLGEEIKADFEDVVSDWQTKVSFRKTIKVEAGGIEITIGPATNARIWHFVDKGTKPHIIRAKTDKGLRYRKGYSARTQPGRAHVGTGQSTGPWRRRQEVMHPGQKEPRDFTKTIYNKWQPELKRTIMQAIRDAKRG